MSREKQIEELTDVIANMPNSVDCIVAEAEYLYDKGYRKQIEGEWVNNHCSVCGMTPLDEEVWKDLGLTPPKFEYCMDFCPTCGAKMKGAEQ